MTIAKLKSKIESLKEVTPDQRIEFEEEIVRLQDEISEVQEILQNIPDVEPEEGVADPRLEFVEKLMSEAQEKTNTEKSTSRSKTA